MDGAKEKLRFFHNHIVEVKTMSKGGNTAQKGSELFIQDLVNEITLYWYTKHTRILQVEIEKDAIFYLAENVTGKRIERVLCKLYEMEDNVKIQTLMKRGLYKEALEIASAAKFPPEVKAEINKAWGDHLYSKKTYDEAIEQFINTIGFLNPSYVI